MLEIAKAEKETLENAGLKVNVEFGEIKKPQAKVETSAGSSSQVTTVKTVKVPANGGENEAAAEGDSKKEKEPKDNGENEAAADVSENGKGTESKDEASGDEGKKEEAPAAEEAPKENDMLEFLAV